MLTFEIDEIQADGKWYGVVRLSGVEIYRGSGGDTRGQVHLAVQEEFAKALKSALAAA